MLSDITDDLVVLEESAFLEEGVVLVELLNCPKWPAAAKVSQDLPGLSSGSTREQFAYFAPV